jgi:hypothetical protein
MIDPIGRSAKPFSQGDVPDAHGAQSARDIAAINPIPIAERQTAEDKRAQRASGWFGSIKPFE